MDKTNADCVENSESHVVKIIHVSRGKKPKGTRNLGTPFKVEVSFLFIISQCTPPSFLKEGLVSRDFFLSLDEFLLHRLETSRTYEPLDSKGATQRVLGASFLPFTGRPRSLDLVLSCKRLFWARTRVPGTLISIRCRNPTWGDHGLTQPTSSLSYLAPPRLCFDTGKDFAF